MQSAPAAALNGLPAAKHQHYADSIWCTYIISVVSASIAEMGGFEHGEGAWEHSNQNSDNRLFVCIPVTYPLDLTKARLQIQGEASASKLFSSDTKPKSVSGFLG